MLGKGTVLARSALRQKAPNALAAEEKSSKEKTPPRGGVSVFRVGNFVS
jgi:hypothetical protein